MKQQPYAQYISSKSCFDMSTLMERACKYLYLHFLILNAKLNITLHLRTPSHGDAI